MVQDKASGARKDFNVSPVSRSKINLGYFLATVLNSLMVNGLALVIGLIYIGKMGWYLSFVDVLWIIFDEILLVLFGSTLSSIISYPLLRRADVSSRNNCQRRRMALSVEHICQSLILALDCRKHCHIFR